MDITTLLICSALVSGIMTLFISALYVTGREERFLYDWVGAGFFFFVASFLGLYGTVFDLPELIFPSINNAFYLTAHALVFTGIQKLVKQKSDWRMLVLLFVMIVLVQLLPALKESVTVRVAVFYPIITLFNLLSIHLLIRHRDLEFSKAFWLLGITLTVFVIQNVTRGLVFTIEDIELPFIDVDIVKFSGTLSLIAFLFLLTLSMTVIVMWKKEVKLMSLSRTDSLTGWNNRRALTHIANREFERRKRISIGLGFLVLDLDHFKRINDTFGHKQGDLVLEHFCRTLERLQRKYDYQFRLGGEEFAILATDTDSEQLLALAERMRGLIEANPYQCDDGSLIELTVSVGAAMSIEGQHSWEAVLNMADKALYDAKQNGRNRSSIFCPEIASQQDEPQQQSVS